MDRPGRTGVREGARLLGSRLRALSYLGLQRRIMLYVALGLAVIFGGFYYLSMGAVRESTSLMFEARLAIARQVALALGREIEHVSLDVDQALHRLDWGEGTTGVEQWTRGLYDHLKGADRFLFFTVEGVAVLDPSGRPLASAPQGYIPPLHTSAFPLKGEEPTVIWPQGEDPSAFVTLLFPVRHGGEVVARVMVHTIGKNRRGPFIPFAYSDTAQGEEESEEVARIAHYHLEVINPVGRVVLGIGPDESPGQLSLHYPLVKEWVATGRSGTMLHRMMPGQGRSHVMAVVPVPKSPLYLVLEQDQDVALALPNRFRRQALLFSSLGFLLTMVVAWVTTRQVVRPTERLTAAAVRMAQGELSTPIRVQAQDEVGVLARNLELMRRQLKQALEEVERVNRELEMRVRERTLQLQELVQRVLAAQEEERHRIALELHDETAQSLTALAMALDAILRRNQGLSPRELQRLREARQLAADTLEEVRRLIHALRPAALEHMGLGPALRAYVEEFLEPEGVALHMESRGQPVKLPQQVELALYRIGQEAINNIARHARARNAWVTLETHPDRAVLLVRDDGVGFDPSDLGRQGGKRGVGIAGMQERAHLIGGALTVRSAPGKGTEVRVEVPLERG